MACIAFYSFYNTVSDIFSYQFDFRSNYSANYIINNFTEIVEVFLTLRASQFGISINLKLLTMSASDNILLSKLNHKASENNST